MFSVTVEGQAVDIKAAFTWNQADGQHLLVGRETTTNQSDGSGMKYIQ